MFLRIAILESKMSFNTYFQFSTRRWTRLKDGPSARHNAAIELYQQTILICGGSPNCGDLWGYHTELDQWLQWSKTLPKMIGGKSFIKNEVLYSFTECQNGSSLFVHGFDLVERQTKTFYNKIEVSFFLIFYKPHPCY